MTRSVSRLPVFASRIQKALSVWHNSLSMRTVLLPVKDFKNAKQRLSAAYSEQQRAGLARAMLADVLHSISNASLPDRVVVFTASPEVVAMAREYRFECADEVSVQGHSAAVNSMVPELMRESSHILSIAADLP